MRRRVYLGSFELMVLLVVLRLGDEAYGVPICHALEEQSGHGVAVASVYAALQRLEEKGLVASAKGEPTAERGGRAKRYFRVTPKGVRETRRTQQAFTTLWRGLPQLHGGTV